MSRIDDSRSSRKALYVDWSSCKVMPYSDYLVCARKHLKSIKRIFDSCGECKYDFKYVWLELYYLSGYIFEGLAVYAAFAIKGWPKELPIRSRDRHEGEQIRNLEKEKGISYGKGHNFNELVKTIVYPFVTEQNGDMADIPYFGKGKLDSEVKILIEKWNACIRYAKPEYLTLGKGGETYTLNRDTIGKLLDTCNEVVRKFLVLFP